MTGGDIVPLRTGGAADTAARRVAQARDHYREQLRQLERELATTMQVQGDDRQCELALQPPDRAEDRDRA